MINPIPRGEYPRPQLRRAQWQCLNGPWRIRADEAGDGLKHRWHQKGLGLRPKPSWSPLRRRPLPPGKALSQASCLWYEREFDEVPWDGPIMLHFGAADHWTRVFERPGSRTTPGGLRTLFLRDFPRAQAVAIASPCASKTPPPGVKRGASRRGRHAGPLTTIPSPAFGKQSGSSPCQPRPSAGFTPASPTRTVPWSSRRGFSRPVTGRLSLSIHREGSVVAQAAVEVDYRSEARLSFTLANAARSGIPTTQRSTTLPQPSRIPSREPLTKLRATSGFEKFPGMGRDCALTGSGSISGVFLIKVISRTGGIPGT